MPLIKCPDCDATVSDKATVCPHCGCPLQSAISESSEELQQFPDLPAILNVGKERYFVPNAELKDVFYSYTLNNLKYVREGKVDITTCTNGIYIHGGLSMCRIHFDQIIDMKCVPLENFEEQNKSVIGRAIVGGLLLGPLGAIVGGMSGIGKKVKQLGKFVLIINFWDIYSHQIQSIVIATKENVNKFIKFVEEEKSKNNDPEGANYIANVFKSPTEIDEDKMLIALSESNRMAVEESLRRNGNIPEVDISSTINEIASKNNYDMSQVKSGCFGVVLAMITVSASLAGCLFMLICK